MGLAVRADARGPHRPDGAGDPARGAAAGGRARCSPATTSKAARPATTRLYLPRRAYLTGDLNVHDLAFDEPAAALALQHALLLPRLAERRFSFVPQWKPPFVSELVPEDRCHLNGLAMVEDGRPKFVTCLGETDTPGGWRDARPRGGVLVDVDSGRGRPPRAVDAALAARCMTAPLWLLNSGAGELWRVDLSRGTHDVVCALPGLPARALLRRPPLRRRRAVPGPREAHLRRPARAAAARPAAVRRRDHRPAVAAQVALFEFTAGVPGAVRRAVPTRRSPADDPEPGEGGGPPGVHRARLRVLAPPRVTRCRGREMGARGRGAERAACSRAGRSTDKKWSLSPVRRGRLFGALRRTSGT